MDPSRSSSSEGSGARVYPHNIEAERAVLGGILIENEAINRALEFVKDVDFYLERHRKIFGRMIAMFQENRPIDMLLLADSFRQEGLLEEIGGLTYLSSLTDAVPLTTNISQYAQIVAEKAVLRRLLEVTQDISERVLEGQGNTRELLDHAEQTIFQVAESKARQSLTPMSEVIQSAFTHIERLYDRQEEVTGVPTGFERLDQMLAGFQGSDLIITAARPSMGKTAFALNVAANAALRANVPVAFFSLEMSKEQLAVRLLCSESRVDASKVRTGRLGEDDWALLARGAEKLYDAPIYIDDTPGINVLDVRAKCRRLRAERGLGMVMIDYLQLMSGVGKLNSREQEISQISRSLKGLAKELHIPVIALSQLNRSLESRTDKRPMMSDLRESGAIEQDADVILFIYRDAVYKRKEGAEDHLTLEERRHAEIIIGKQRNGPIGTVELAYIGEHTRFENYSGPSRAPSGD